MAKLGISTGSVPNDGTGDSLLDAAVKINTNFTEIYNYLGDGSSILGIGGTWEGTETKLYTLKSVGISTNNPRFELEVGSVGTSGTSLWINGDVRVTNQLVIGESSITIDGDNNIINVGSGVTINGDAGTIASASFVGDGSSLTGVIKSLVGYATEGYVTDSLVGYATEGYVNNQGFVTSGIVVGYATEGYVLDQLSDYATTFYVDNTLLSYATLTYVNNSLVGYATEGYVNNQGFVTSGIVVGYATEGYVNNQGFVTSGIVVGYATEGYVQESINNKSYWEKTNIGIHTLSNVGIGTTNPQYKLDVDGSVRVSGIVSCSEFYLNSNISFSTIETSETLAILSPSVGIGTTNPTSKFTVLGGDISVGINTDHGIILSSPSGNKYRLIVDDVGALSTVAV